MNNQKLLTLIAALLMVIVGFLTYNQFYSPAAKAREMNRQMLENEDWSTDDIPNDPRKGAVSLPKL